MSLFRIESLLIEYFYSVYDLNTYIRFTPSYYDDDMNLPILEEISYTRKRLYSVEDIVRLLLHPSLKSSKFVCSNVPTSVSKGVSFVIDLDSLDSKDDVCVDDMGVWKNNGVDTNYVRVTMGKSSVNIVQKCTSKDRKSGAYSVKRVHRTHGTDRSLKKITAFVYGE